MYDHVSGGRHGVRGQEPDNGRVLAGVGDLHGAGHDDVTSAENLVADVLQALCGVHLDFDVLVDLRDDENTKIRANVKSIFPGRVWKSNKIPFNSPLVFRSERWLGWKCCSVNSMHW